MNFRTVLVLALLAAPSLAAAAASPPVAEKRPFMVTSPNGARRDDYYWLRDDTRKNPEMLGYLKAENAYADAVLAGTKPLADKLYAEIVSHFKQDDSAAPYRQRSYWYYTRYLPGQEYSLLARRKGDMGAPEQVMLDEPAMAKGGGFFAVGNWSVSPDNRLLAYAEDRIGRRQYALKVKDLSTGRLLGDIVSNIEPNLEWADDNRTVFYLEKDPVTLLSKRVKAHVLGTPAASDRLVYEEKDDTFEISLHHTRSGKYLCIQVHSTVSDEWRCAPAAHPDRFALLAPRLRDFHYEADHLDGRWVFRTDWQAKNYRLMSLADGEALGDRKRWKVLVAGRPDAFIEAFLPYRGGVAAQQRQGGNMQMVLYPDGGAAKSVTADAPAFAMTLDVNEDPDSPWVRYTYDTLIAPTTTYEVNVATDARRVLKITPVPGYDPANYVTERVWVTARDGTRIPVSLAYRKGFRKDGTAAMLQYGYGSYGLSSDPYLVRANIGLMDRGMIYALAHIRGGQEMGRGWYDDGHLLHKKNTFTDFIDVTRGLVKMGYAAPGRVAALGGSAGGLLMGAVANMAPQDYRAIIAEVPFVDVVTTMLDETIPLTTGEFDEWGNPAKKIYYDYMLSYSPYDNVARRAYPAMYVSTGLWDSQVQYYEPTKWVAKLRALKTDANPLVLRINMQAGHGGNSGRFRAQRDEAEYDAFMLDRLGVR